MDDADRELWAQVKTIAADALEVPEPEREAWVRENCGGDPKIVTAVLRLLGFAEVLENPTVPHGPLLGRFSGKAAGPYQIHWLLGAGGAGEVYLATRAGNAQGRLAIKFLRADCTHPGLVRRFRAESQILAALDHPNIVKLLDAGETEDGQPWFVMEYVEGRPINAYCAENKLPIERRLGLFRDVCTTVQYAHGHLLVHRDLKPGNILVTASGNIKLLDFGIAKLLQPDLIAAADQSETTTIWDRPLTPRYASPEQLGGAPVTTASDIYSLGIVLYELATGTVPFSMETSGGWTAFIREVGERDPKSPSAAVSVGAIGKLGVSDVEAVRRRLRGEIDDVILKAIEKAPERRYSTAAEFADDLLRHMTGRPVRAHPDTWIYRAGKFAGRNKAAIAAAGAVTVSLVGGLAATLQQKALADRDLAQVRGMAQTMARTFAEVQNSCLAAIPASKNAAAAESAAAAKPGDSRLEDQLAASYNVLVDTLRADGQSAAATRAAQKLVDLRTRIAGERPGDSGAQQALAQAKQLYSSPASAVSEAPGGGQRHGPNTAEVAASLFQLGEVLRVSKDNAGAATAYRSSISIYEGLVAADPGDGKIRSELGRAQTALQAVGAK